MHRREIAHHERDNNRLVRPLEWGLSFISDHVNGDDPRDILSRYSNEAMRRSDRFYELPQIEDFELQGDQLTWTSAVRTPSDVNNLARARYFPSQPRKSSHARAAVLVLPQWNAQPNSHVEACRIFNLLGICALRLTLPYHEHRKPPELERADHLVSTNVGRTIQSMRQAVLDTRAAVKWLKTSGYERVGILGTSVGSCIAFLAFAHEPHIDAGTFNHVSGYVADVVWRGLSTKHLREGFGDTLTIEELRDFWAPISPVPFIPRVPAMGRRPIRFIAARYDLTFPEDLSQQVIFEALRFNLPLDVVWLPCGHYTLADMPWRAIDAWKIAMFFRKHLR